MKNNYLLFTPGPLTTSLQTKRSMLSDWGSWDSDFNAITSDIRKRLIKIVNGDDKYTCIPLQGSGSFGVEAMLINYVKKKEKILILINGAYGERIKKICDYHKIKNLPFIWSEDKPLDLLKLKNTLKKDKSIKNLAFVHCETSTGILNPLQEVSKLCKIFKINLLIDAMSSFGALDINSKKISYKALVASSNKCLEGVPGMCFVISKKTEIKKCNGNSDNLCMDLYDQWVYMEKTGRWRYTPPTHVVVAFLEALKQFSNEGSVRGRYARYKDNVQNLINGMNKIGINSLLPKKIQSPIIATFLSPSDKKFKFEKFYQYLKGYGYIIYPGKMAKQESFRIGCIGHIGKKEINNLVSQIEKFLKKEKISTDRYAS